MLQANFFSSMAARLGITPQDLYDRYQLRVSARQPGGQVLNDQFDQQGQLITDTPAFQNWFGDSKVVDADGRPLVMYHATTADFNEFQQNTRGVHFVSPSASWVSKFLVDDAGATADGANVLPVYVTASNPFDYENRQHVNALARAASMGTAAINQIKKGSWARLEDRTTLA